MYLSLMQRCAFSSAGRSLRYLRVRPLSTNSSTGSRDSSSSFPTSKSLRCVSRLILFEYWRVRGGRYRASTEVINLIEIVSRSEDWHRLKSDMDTSRGSSFGTDTFQSMSATNASGGAGDQGSAQALTAAERAKRGATEILIFFVTTLHRLSSCYRFRLCKQERIPAPNYMQTKALLDKAVALTGRLPLMSEEKFPSQAAVLQGAIVTVSRSSVKGEVVCRG